MIGANLFVYPSPHLIACMYAVFRVQRFRYIRIPIELHQTHTFIFLLGKCWEKRCQVNHLNVYETRLHIHMKLEQIYIQSYLVIVLSQFSRCPRNKYKRPNYRSAWTLAYLSAYDQQSVRFDLLYLYHAPPIDPFDTAVDRSQNVPQTVCWAA